MEAQLRSEESAPLIRGTENGASDEARDQEEASIQLVLVRHELYIDTIELLPIAPTRGKHILPDMSMSPRCHQTVTESDEAHFWLNGYVNKQNCRIWSEANPQVYVETPLHPEKLTVWCALWTGGILLQKR
ncbi:uncharacterized protein TNCV_573731 [Trichonephila clavipes]|nr:uncharacterized protein TNCV_573731 [Trichonephila clavipes]